MNRRQFLQRLMMTPAVLPALPGILKAIEAEQPEVKPTLPERPVVYQWGPSTFTFTSMGAASTLMIPIDFARFDR